MSDTSISYLKYLKYKAKYMQLKHELSGGGLGPVMSSADADAVIAFINQPSSPSAMGQISKEEASVTPLGTTITGKQNLINFYKTKRNLVSKSSTSVPTPSDAQWASYFLRVFPIAKADQTNDSKWISNNNNLFSNILGGKDLVPIADFKSKLTK
jgi:hypothetical protein